MSVPLQVIALILIGAGLVCSVIFHIGTKEPSDDSVDRKLSSSTAEFMVNLPTYMLL